MGLLVTVMARLLGRIAIAAKGMAGHPCGECELGHPRGSRRQKRRENREAANELTRLGEELDLPAVTPVCLTHMRFIPCRTGEREGGCVLSEAPEDIARVSEFQRRRQ